MFHELTCWLFACLCIMVCVSSSFASNIVPVQQRTRVTNKLLLQNNLVSDDASSSSDGNIVPAQERTHVTNKLLQQNSVSGDALPFFDDKIMSVQQSAHVTNKLLLQNNLVSDDATSSSDGSIVIAQQSPHVTDNLNQQTLLEQDEVSSSFDSNIVPVQQRSTNKLLLPDILSEDAKRPSSGVRSKRGIVLIDEDLDVPPGPGWKDGDSDRMEDNGTTIFQKDQGSGSSETTREDYNLTKSPRFATPANLKKTSVPGDPLSTFDEEYADLEGSADEPSSTMTSLVSETEMEGKDDKISIPTSSEASRVNSTTGVSSTAYISTSTEASKEILTTVGSTHFSTSTETVSEHVYEPIPQHCLNSTCNPKDLIILPITTKTVPEGTNLTLSCTMSNATDGSLKWYKYINESDHLMLEENNEGLKISFSIPKSKQHHSGRYLCLLSTKQSCCHKKLDIKIYEIPNYKQNFIIIGGVAAASLLVCILLGIHRSVKTKRYDEAIEYQNGVEKPFLL